MCEANLNQLSKSKQATSESVALRGFPYYPEYSAKSNNGITPTYPSCTKGFIIGQCSTGHTHAKIALCGKEWCSTCGAIDSFYHKRRYNRWWQKAMSLSSMGYLVVTIPRELWPYFQDKKKLNQFNKFIIRKLQRDWGKDKGLSRWHWAGEDGRTFKPHLNFLFEGAYIPKKELRAFNRDVGKWLNNAFRGVLRGLSVTPNLNYQYFTDDAHKVHKLKYVTRATMLSYNEIVAIILKGFRTTRTWGKWDKPKQARTSDLVSYVNGQCPCCGERIKWDKGYLSAKGFHLLYGSLTHSVTHVDGGYYQIEEINTS